MQFTLEQLRAEKARLEEVREKLWADLNRAIGAQEQLSLLIAHMEAPEPEP